MIGERLKARRRQRRTDKLLRDNPRAHKGKPIEGTEVILVPRLIGRKKR